MPSLLSLKREVEILHKALNVDHHKEDLQLKKCLYLSDKLIELSRDPDDKALLALNLEIIAFLKQYPPTPDDLIKIQPYLDTINLAANHCLGNNET
jgi:hypothetical protein